MYTMHRCTLHDVRCTGHWLPIPNNRTVYSLTLYEFFFFFFGPFKWNAIIRTCCTLVNVIVIYVVTRFPLYFHNNFMNFFSILINCFLHSEFALIRNSSRNCSSYCIFDNLIEVGKRSPINQFSADLISKYFQTEKLLRTFQFPFVNWIFCVLQRQTYRPEIFFACLRIRWHCLSKREKKKKYSMNNHCASLPSKNKIYVSATYSMSCSSVQCTDIVVLSFLFLYCLFSFFFSYMY